ncbi:alpha/beta hydrolase [Flavihumibacter sediminis]|nr:alpha/beta hydrolase [Flavihumibacter sediminis]
MREIIIISFLLINSIFLNAQEAEEVHKIKVGDVELHYIEKGKGEPMILLHGGQGDYRAWPKQLEAFASRYRVISYSRRYHFPNQNMHESGSYSALTDANDLAGFIAALNLGAVHLVGTSYGAFTALAFAIDHPELVKTMVLAEPPVLQWATRTDRGAELYKEFMTTVHKPAGKAFAAGDREGAMRILINRFDGVGAFDSLPAERRKIVMQNSNFFKAVTNSSDPFPNLARDKVASLRMPVLMVRGQHTKELDILVSDEIIRTIPNAERAIIPLAGHGSPRQNPVAFNEAVLAFLSKHHTNNR